MDDIVVLTGEQILIVARMEYLILPPSILWIRYVSTTIAALALKTGVIAQHMSPVMKRFAPDYWPSIVLRPLIPKPV